MVSMFSSFAVGRVFDQRLQILILCFSYKDIDNISFIIIYNKTNIGYPFSMSSCDIFNIRY